MRNLVALLLLAVLGTPAHAVAPFFSQPFDPRTSNAQEAADLDGDGLADLVHIAAATVEVRMAGPSRTFGAVQSASFLAPVDRVRALDFDGDGDRDLAGLSTGSIELLVHAGGGVYGNPSSLPMPAGQVARNFATGDLDGDGRDDLVVVANLPGEFHAVLIVWRAVAGGFAPPVTRSTVDLTDGFRNDMVIAKVAGDPYPDIVFAGGADGIAVHRGNGDGTLQDALLLAGVTYVNDTEVADVDGDAIADLVVAFDAGTQTLRLYPGHGDGTFGAAQVLWTGNYVVAVAVGDVDGGGKADVVFSSFGPGAAMLRGEDGLDPAKLRPLISAGPGRPVRVADMDGDGRRDVFVGGPHGIYWGDPDGTPGEWASSSAAGGSLQSIAVLDVSGDHQADLVSTTSVSAITVERGHGDGTFEPPVNFGPASPAAVDFGDVNGDGNVDAVLGVVVAGQYTIQVLSGTGNASCFSGTQSTPTGIFAEGFSGVGGLVVADVNDDGRADVVISGNMGGLTGPGPPFLRCYLGVASGPLTLASDAPVSISRLALADMNSDDLPDLVGVTNTGLEVRPSTGTGAFGAPLALSYPPGIYTFALGRMNAGSAMDCVIVGYDHVASVALGNGDGSLATPVPIAGAAPCLFASLADVNGDGYTDAILNGSTAGDPGRIELRIADGTGVLPESSMLSTGAAGYSPVRVADLNSDGRPDLVLMGYSSRNVSALHFNLLPPTIGVPPAPMPQPRIALSSASPQRITRGLQVRFALTGEGPARLEVFDVAGRRLARVAVGELGPGAHTVTVPATAAPGVLFVRLTRGVEHVTERIATIR